MYVKFIQMYKLGFLTLILCGVSAQVNCEDISSDISLDKYTSVVQEVDITQDITQDIPTTVVCDNKDVPTTVVCDDQGIKGNIYSSAKNKQLMYIFGILPLLIL